MAVVVLNLGDVLVALGKVLVIVEVAAVAGDAVVVAHIDGAGHLLSGDEGLIKFLAVAGADNSHLCVAVLGVELGIGLLQGLGKGAEGGGRGLLDEEVAIMAVGEGIDDEVDGIVEGHHEAGHVGVGDGDGLALHHLLDPKRNDATTRGHNVAIASAADGGLGTFAKGAALRNGDLLHHGLGDAHGIDGVSCLVGAEHHDILHAVGDGGEEHVVGSLDIGAHGLHGEELAGGHLLESSSAEDVVDTAHGEIDGLALAHGTSPCQTHRDAAPEGSGACRPASSRRARGCGFRGCHCRGNGGGRRFRRNRCLR